MSQRILVTGATGSLGRVVFQRAAAAGWNTVGTYAAEPSNSGDERLDIRDADDVWRVLGKVKPDVVVHAATGRDRDDWAATADGAANVAAAAREVGARLVHVSSDAVHRDGEHPYGESALPAPLNRYGAAKAAAETAVKAVDPAAAIVRVPVILGDGRGYSEILTHDLVSRRRTGILFTDMIRMPVHVDDLSDALLELSAGGYRGVINVAGDEAISRYDLGVLIAVRDGLDPAAIPAGRGADLDPRPALDVRLDITRAKSLLSTRLRGAREFMTAVL